MQYALNHVFNQHADWYHETENETWNSYDI